MYIHIYEQVDRPMNTGQYIQINDCKYGLLVRTRTWVYGSSVLLPLGLQVGPLEERFQEV